MSGPPPPFPFMPRPGMPPLPMPGMPPPGMMPPYGGPPRPVFPVGGPPPMQPMYGGPPRPQSVMARPQFLSTMARPPVMLPKPILPAAERVPKKTTIYVGKIAPTVDDEFLKQLLEACGEMKSWKRMVDPANNQPKGFGFCEYEEADGCQRAIRLLNSLMVDGQELLLKADSATQKYLDEYQKDKEREAKEKKVKKAAEAEQGEVVQEETEEEKDNDVLVKIMGLLSDRAEKVPKQKADSDRANELLASIEKPREKDSHREEKHTTLPGPPIRDLRTERQIEAARALELERQKEREMERAFEMERQQKKREEDAKKRESDRLYDSKCREWDKTEREMLKARDKEKQKEAEYERFKQIRADLEGVDTDDELEPWARKPYRTSRRAEERRRKRAKEELEDEEDRLREAAELEELARRQAEAEEQRRQMQEEAGVKEEEEAVKMELDAAEVKPEPEPAFDPNDPIYQAMIAAAKAPPPIKHETPPHASPQPQASHPPAASTSQPQYAPEPAAPTQPIQRSPLHHLQPTSAAAMQPQGISFGAKKPNLASIFGEEEEETATKKRKLVPLQYTEEEVKAVQSSAVEDPKMLLRKVADSIPTTRDGVFNYKIKWDAYDPETVAPKLSKWVAQKIKELVGGGEDVPDVVQFIMELLQGHAVPQKLFDEVHPIIDTDAESFVIKLYRMVIFETEKAASGL